MPWFELRPGDDLRGFETDGDVDVSHIFIKAVQCIDRSLGRPRALLADEAAVIRYMIVSTDASAEYLEGKDVIVPIDAIERQDEDDIYIGAASDELDNIPAFEPDRPVTIDMERASYAVFGIPTYWEARVGLEESENEYYRFLDSYEVFPPPHAKGGRYDERARKVVIYRRRGAKKVERK